MIYTSGAHLLKLGIWYERAQHRQTGPAVPVDAQGNPATVWLNSSQITRADGSLFQSRDWDTISTASALYVSDAFNFLDDKAQIVGGLRAPRVTRDFTNFPSEGASSQTYYRIKQDYSDVLPQVGVRYHLDKQSQLFANVAKTFRAPPNFAFSPTNNNIAVVNGVATVVGNIKAETSINTDIGYRYQGNDFSFSATAFDINFSNRQGNAFDPNLLKSVYTNAGKVSNQGVELELGTAPMGAWSFYGSASFQKSDIRDDLLIGNGQRLPTKGKEYPLTPHQLLAVTAQWAQGPITARFKAKHTGRQYATLMNDEAVPVYTTSDFDGSYKLGSFDMVKNIQLRFNVSNVFNTKYRNPSSGTVINAKAVGATPASTVFYYLGAPRLISFSISADI
jgi:iron complex outermembrane recepter protein